MGRKKRTITTDASEAFKSLDREYQANQEGNRYVAALNLLPADERSLMIMYVATGNNKTKLAKSLDCSWPYLHERIQSIQAKLKQLINSIPE